MRLATPSPYGSLIRNPLSVDWRSPRTRTPFTPARRGYDGQVPGLDMVPGEQHGSPDGVAQLAYVAGPRVSKKEVGRLRGGAGDMFA